MTELTRLDKEMHRHLAWQDMRARWWQGVRRPSESFIDWQHELALKMNKRKEAA